MADHQSTPESNHAQELTGRRCVRCCGPVDRDGSRCSKCLQFRRKRIQRTGDTRCSLCDKEKENPKALVCASCRASALSRKQKLYEKRREAGLCTTCGLPAKPGHFRCEKCLARRRATEGKNRKVKERFCRDCKSGPLPHRWYLCAACRQRVMNERAARARKRADAEGKCHDCWGPNDRPGKRCTKCLEKARLKRLDIKRRVMEGYGGRCACCGEAELTFLTLDHVYNDGNQKRASGMYPGSGVGSGLYRWVINNNFPDDLQCLCANCQIGRKINGGVCPHQEKRDTRHH